MTIYTHKNNDKKENGELKEPMVVEDVVRNGLL